MVLPLAVVALAVLWSFGLAFAFALCRTAMLGDRAVDGSREVVVTRPASGRRAALAPVRVAPVHASKRPLGGLNP